MLCFCPLKFVRRHLKIGFKKNYRRALSNRIFLFHSPQGIFQPESRSFNFKKMRFVLPSIIIRLMTHFLTLIKLLLVNMY